MNLNKYDYNKKVNYLFIFIDLVMIGVGLILMIYFIPKGQWIWGIVSFFWYVTWLLSTITDLIDIHYKNINNLWIEKPKPSYKKKSKR